MMMVTTAQATHDVAVISVMPNPTWVEAGELVNITVVVENQGTASETFNVTAYHDATAIETRNVTNLAPGANITLNFSWNTTDLYWSYKWHLGTYTINATASTVPGETDKEDNTLVSLDKVRVFLSPYIAVIPDSVVDPNLTPDTSFTVSIYTDYTGDDVWGWQFTLSFNPLVLHGVDVTNGDLIENQTMFIAGDFNNTAGTLSLTGNFFFYGPGETPPTTSGPGTLANVTFTVVGTGESDITLGDETQLKAPTYNIIDVAVDTDHVWHGYFRNTEEPVTHDVAVISIAPNPTSVEAGELVNITVVVENQGNVIEEVTVEVGYGYDSTLPTRPRRPIATRTIHLESGASTTLNFTWDTTTAEKGTHPIIAVAKLPSGVADAEPDDNMFYDENVTVTVRAHVGTPIPIGLLAAIAVGVVVIAVVVYALRRRRSASGKVSSLTLIFSSKSFLYRKCIQKCLNARNRQ